MKSPSSPDRDALMSDWLAAWPAALALWSRFVQLHEPKWCFDRDDERREQLSGSFAMIRLVDHSIVVSLSRVHENKLDRFALEILAHEIGHHVYCPADLTDNARLLARMRRGLPTQEQHAPMISNLYADLLINDRLQRAAGLDMAAVYRQLECSSTSRLWNLYLRIYELLWKLPAGDLVQGDCDARLHQDAQLGARLVRSYAKDWLGGAGRFAALCLPYLIEDEAERIAGLMRIWSDTCHAGRGGVPEGLAEIDDDEIDGPIHPAEDPDLSGIDEPFDTGQDQVAGRTPAELSGRKTLKNYRQPFEYAEVVKAAGVELDDRQIAARYYQERALPYLIPFPVKRLPKASEPLPEGLDVWDVGSPLESVDWLGTLLASPTIIPGVTMRERHFGASPGCDPDATPFDLYLGIDCSGSMGDPAYRLSYPVLAGTIVALSALRAGASVKVVLSGEPGQTISTDGFIRNPQIVLRTLASYLGSGYAFGIHRLAETFAADNRLTKPVHVLIVSDTDMFRMLDEQGNGRVGWNVASDALGRCGGGGTFVLQIPEEWRIGKWFNSERTYLERISQQGWNVALVDSMEDLVAFARQFSRANFERKPAKG